MANITIALAGNPNCGKTTLFNALTGSNQYVGNWPGVTVEEKHGKLKGHADVTIADLPGIYSLSPYTLEEVVARDYLTDQRPDAILNIVDGTNLERNLYLTTQLVELGIPVLVAVNMMDVIEKQGDVIDLVALSKALDCKVVAISALKVTGIKEAAEEAVALAKSGVKPIPQHRFAGSVEHALAHIEEVTVHNLPEASRRSPSITCPRSSSAGTPSSSSSATRRSRPSLASPQTPLLTSKRTSRPARPSLTTTPSPSSPRSATTTSPRSSAGACAAPTRASSPPPTRSTRSSPTAS